jgi:hypothetical protein
LRDYSFLDAFSDKDWQSTKALLASILVIRDAIDHANSRPKELLRRVLEAEFDDTGEHEVVTEIREFLKTQ